MYTYYRNSKSIVGVTFGGFVLATLFCKLGGATAQGCNLLNRTCVALEVLRSVILLAGWHAVSAYLFEDSRPWQHLPQIVASIWSLLCVTVSWAR
jgi:hypothetical protein